jgi:hypothetical protein
MDPALEKALAMLDQASALIQELVAQLQSKQQEKNMSKQAEVLAVKTGMSFEAASDMIKTAEEKGTTVEALTKAAEMINRNTPFGKVASQERELTKTGSVAMDKYLDREQAIMDELGL